MLAQSLDNNTFSSLLRCCKENYSKLSIQAADRKKTFQELENILAAELLCGYLEDVWDHDYFVDVDSGDGKPCIKFVVDLTDDLQSKYWVSKTTLEEVETLDHDDSEDSMYGWLLIRTREELPKDMKRLLVAWNEEEGYICIHYHPEYVRRLMRNQIVKCAIVDPGLFLDVPEDNAKSDFWEGNTFESWLESVRKCTRDKLKEKVDMMWSVFVDDFYALKNMLLSEALAILEEVRPKLFKDWFVSDVNTVE